MKSGSNHPPTDGRSLRKQRARPARESAHRFFRWAYQHEAETLPDLRDVHAEPASSDEDPEMPEHVVLPADEPEELKSLDPFAMTSKPKDLDDKKQKQNLDERYLSWNSFKGFYRQFVAMAGLLNLAIVSWSTFWTTYKSSWEHCLKFRGCTQHGKCDDCEDYKEHLRGAKTKAEEETYTREYTKHQREQFADRGVYYTCRAASECFFQWIAKSIMGVSLSAAVERTNSTLCLIIDGMDQAKFRCPRTPKDMT